MFYVLYILTPLWGTPIQKCDFNKVAHVRRTPLKKSSGGLLLKIVTFLSSKQSSGNSNDRNKCKIDKIILINFKV